MIDKKNTTTMVVVMTLLVLLPAAASAQTSGLSGRVVEVAGSEVAIHVCANPMPVAGALVEIGFPAPIGEEVGSFGVWRILEVRECLLWVSAVCNTALPGVGQSATVLVNAADLQPAYTSQPQFVEKTDPQIERQERISKAIIGLSSPDSLQCQEAAKILYRHYRYEIEVQQAAERALLMGYNLNPNDRAYVDAMAWLCNILGASGQPGYREVLDEVARMTTSPKIRDYARKNLHRLG